MRYTTTDSEPKLVALLAAAQYEPVFIERGDQQVAVLVSSSEYDRLRNAANADFQDFCDEIADRAAARGLTETKLDELLNRV